jgi:NADH:ubiquinone oxidoreductase subunit 2 (subunit N)
LLKNNLKLFIAFTGVNQVAFILIPLVFFTTLELLASSFYYLYFYIFANFVFILALDKYTTADGKDIVTFSGLREVGGNTNPLRR